MKIIKVILFILILSIISCAQKFAPKALVWEYDFTPYPDSTIYFIMYTKAENIDTGFYAIDTTEVEALRWDLISQTALYNFTWRNFYATAIQSGFAPGDTITVYWSYESVPSDTVREFFRTLPPAAIKKGQYKYVSCNRCCSAGY